MRATITSRRPAALPSLPILLLPTLLLSALLVACGGPGPEPAPSPFDSQGGTTGGEDGAAQGEAEPEPVVIPSTTPVAVPQPAVARDEMREGLQRSWMRTERAVEVSPPAPPTEGTVEDVQAWAEGPFADWMRERRAAVAEAENDVGFLVNAQPYERGVAAALFGYMYEDTAASMRGAPVPEEIATDPELLGVYVETLSTALLPYAQSAAEAYATCASTFAQLGEEAWAEWAAYCADRARDIVDVYELEVEGAPEAQPEAGEPGAEGQTPQDGQDAEDAQETDEAGDPADAQ